MPNGIVYILENPCLKGWIKIGMTNKGIEERLEQLNNQPNIPLSYRCYATYEVEDPRLVEKHIHSLIDRVDDSLRAREKLSNGRIREREFFQIAPDIAYGIFLDVAALRGDKENLKRYLPTEEQMQEEELAELAENRAKRKNNSFKLLKLPIGTEVTFRFDDSISAMVADRQNSLEFQGKKYSVSALARRLLIDKQGWKESSHVNGWLYFVKDGITLNDLRERLESQYDENT